MACTFGEYNRISRLQRITAIIIALSLLVQTMNKWVILASYYIQKDYIARNLCENRSKPQLHCEGKCCLKKRLAKEGKEQLPTSRNQKTEQVVTLFCADLPLDFTLREFLTPSKSFFTYNDLFTRSFSHSVFRPPACTA